MVAGADLWVYNDEKFCVLIFYQVASIFHLRVGGGREIKLFGQTYWPLWYTRVVSQSKEIVSHIHIFLPGSESCPLFGNASIFSFTKSFSVTPTLSVNSSRLSCSLRLGFGMELCLGPFQTVSYVLEYIRILGEGTQIDWSFWLSSNM